MFTTATPEQLPSFLFRKYGVGSLFPGGIRWLLVMYTTFPWTKYVQLGID